MRYAQAHIKGISRRVAKALLHVVTHGPKLEALRFPVLALVTLVLFVINVFVPDVVPFLDEILLGLVAIVLARLKRKPKPEAEDQATGTPSGPDP